MQFLKTLFWVMLAIGIVLFARENWAPVEIKLWSGLIAEVKLPFLLLVVFLLGFVPTYLLYRGRMWTLKRQMGRPDRVVVGNQPVSNDAPAEHPAPPPPADPASEPAAAPAGRAAARIAKAPPAGSLL